MLLVACVRRDYKRCGPLFLVVRMTRLFAIPTAPELIGDAFSVQLAGDSTSYFPSMAYDRPLRCTVSTSAEVRVEELRDLFEYFSRSPRAKPKLGPAFLSINFADGHIRGPTCQNPNLVRRHCPAKTVLAGPAES